MTTGVLYFSGGNLSYLQNAVLSAKSVKVFAPNLSVSLIYDFDERAVRQIDLSVFDEIRKIQSMDKVPKHLSGKMRPFLGKIQSLSQSPYDRTLFLDVDTRLRSPIGDLFLLLERFDMVMAPGPQTQLPRNDLDYISSVPSSFPELNTGVILYRKNPKVYHLFRRWERIFRTNEGNLFRWHGEGGDQVALRYLIWNSPNISLYLFSSQGFPNLYNYRWKLGKNFNFDDKIVIHHHHSV